ncbi:Fumarylacetoacetase [hydrothermal vent metagenome]|uniref:fumarylacetoacetase n=1 Tax=hydrothermal vent metagenome TaxID=652676 RepID=A0A3B0S8A4_9ZZZZ
MTQNPTLEPSLESWVPIPDGSDFPVQNLPFGVFSNADGTRCGIAIGDAIVDLAVTHERGLLDGLDLPVDVFAASTLNRYFALGNPTWERVRTRLSHLLTDDTAGLADVADSALVTRADVSMHLPVAVGDFVDFYSSIHHATNVGRMFRPDDEPLLPNWRQLPVAYHGRASTISVSGTALRRPDGQLPRPDGPVFGPTEKLDFELEMAFVTGPANDGKPIPVEIAENSIFGLALLNDWSARDVQAWEYRPLGPFNAKSFATSIAPWIVQLEALAHSRVPLSDQEPTPLPHLATPNKGGFDIALSVDLNGTRVSDSNFRHMYWSMAQQLAHLTSNGTAINPGDVYGSGTISGPTRDSLGCLLEITHNGAEPVTLTDGSQRSFLLDGDEVLIRGHAGDSGAPRIGFGEVRTTIRP